MNKTNLAIASYGLIILSIASYINGQTFICWSSIILSIAILSTVHGARKISAARTIPFFIISLSFLINNKVFSTFYGLIVCGGISLFFDTLQFCDEQDMSFYNRLFLIVCIILNIAFVAVSFLIEPMLNYIFISLLLTAPWLVYSLLKVKSAKMCYN